MPATSIFKMFGQSPIHPLQEHMAKVYECVKQLIPFFDAVIAENWQSAEEAQHHIAQLEGEADIFKRDLRLHLPKSLFMPIPRTDILDLVTTQDRVANKAKDIAGLIFGRHMLFPKTIQKNYLVFLHRCIDASHQANKAVAELDKLLEAGFSGKETHILENIIDALFTIERETDQMQIQVRRDLFEIEKTLEPIHVMFLYEIIEHTGDLANRAQHVGNRLQIIIAR